MAITDGLMGTIQTGGMYMALLIGGGLIVLILVGLVIWMVFMKKKWNLKVEFKMVRSDGRIVIPEWGKGNYDQKQGIIYIKRRKKKAEGLKAKRLDKYLQGSSMITVVGNPGNWRLVIPDTYLELQDEETGEVASVINLKSDMKDDKLWATHFERDALSTFSVQSFMAQYGQYLGFALLLIITIIGQFVGFSIVLGKIK
jgi:hypothetical protein